MKNRFFRILLVAIVLVGLTACGNSDKNEGGKKQNNGLILKSDHFKVDGIYVDESYDDNELALVYLFYTVDAVDENFELSSYNTKIKINDKNTYDAVIDNNFIPVYTNYYYGSVVKKIYVGKSYKMCSTFKVAKGDLNDSKSVTLSNTNINDIKGIKFKTDDIKKKENMAKISEDLDKQTYEVKYKELQDKIADVDDKTVKKVRSQLNGYYFDFYVNIGTKLASVKIEFMTPNKFSVTNSLGLSNHGTYEVKKSALILTYQTGMKLTLHYGYEDGDITLTNAQETFGTLVDYDPLGEED